MTRRMLMLLSLALSFMIFFSAIGFAATSGLLSVTITAKNDIPLGLFITDITNNKGDESNITSNAVSFSEYSTTVKSSVRKSSSSKVGSVTYTITVFNNTDHEYAYRDIYYQTTGNNGNPIISDKLTDKSIKITTDFPDGIVVAPKDYLTFEVTYEFGKTLSRNTTYETLINYQFGINVNSEEEARNAIYNKFLDILNTTSTYKTLTENIDNKFDGYNAWTSNYIGNVADATTEDSLIVNNLFAGQLQMLINGEKKPATVLIKYENVDNNPNTGDDYTSRNTSNGGTVTGVGCEMTLYLTTASLDNPGSWVEVYVAVFTCDKDENGNVASEWYHVGDTYKGTANVVSYDGDWQRGGSFVTDNWVADAQTYSYTPLEPSVTYDIEQDAKLITIMPIVDEVAIQEFQKLLNRAKAVVDNMNYAGAGIIAVENAYRNASKYYTLDASGRPVASSNATRVQLLPHIRTLAQVVKVAEDEIASKQ